MQGAINPATADPPAFFSSLMLVTYTVYQSGGFILIHVEKPLVDLPSKLFKKSVNLEMTIMRRFSLNGLVPGAFY